jgi:hypothetical protein
LLLPVATEGEGEGEGEVKVEGNMQNRKEGG